MGRIFAACLRRKRRVVSFKVAMSLIAVGRDFAIR